MLKTRLEKLEAILGESKLDLERAMPMLITIDDCEFESHEEEMRYCDTWREEQIKVGKPSIVLDISAKSIEENETKWQTKFKWRLK